MSSFHYLFLFGNILLIFISLNHAVSLDGVCTENTQCEGTGLVCRNRKCKCDAPWYTPCTTSQCELNSRFVYEGQECQDNLNCLNNSFCNPQKRCQCNEDFTAHNGLCYKNLNSSCLLSSDCWSGECRDRACRCPDGFVPRGDNRRCQRKLAGIYANWTLANASNDFCYGSSSIGCIDPHATCQNDGQRRENFCQCLSPYIADYGRQECQLREYTGALSPSTTPLPEELCGTCKDENALCIHVYNQTTCWCRSDFTNNNDKCEQIKTDVFIFPNDYDRGQHRYLSNNSFDANSSTTEETNGLRTCKPGYKFVDKTLSCLPIQPQWINDNFEYGVCTRINSHGAAMKVDGLCPDPLRCLPRKDKYVCSCDYDKYLDEHDKQCYNYLERNLTDLTNTACPPFSTLNGIRCECNLNGTYIVSDDKKRCELHLTSTEDNSDCVNDTARDALCTNQYGSPIKFCKQGECRCVSGRSYYDNGGCITLINAAPGNNGTCPNHTTVNGNLCQCNTGYRNRMNRTCEAKATVLYGFSDNPTTSTTDLTDLECKALFPNGPVESKNDECRCKNGTFSNGTTCFYYLGQIPDSGYEGYCPRHAVLDNGPTCECDNGYIGQSDRRGCVPSIDRVDPHNSTSTVNVPGITTGICVAFFGLAAEASSNNNSCQCVHESVAFWDNNKCYFLLDKPQVSTLDLRSCPPNSRVDNATKSCKCLPGYRVTPDNRGCVHMGFSNLQSIDLTTITLTSCTSPNGDDCEALYGEGAVCHNNTCYCDRHRSFVHNGRCVLFSNYIFPGLHEHYSVTCNSQDDCGTDSDQQGIECGYIEHNYRAYTVCKCKNDYLFDPATSKCVKERCELGCPENEECHGYQCVCKVGYYRNSTSGHCVEINARLELHETCDSSFWSRISSPNEELQCSSRCQRGVCISGYRDDGTKCVKYNFNDYCMHSASFCQQFSTNSQCSQDENKCVCSAGYYQAQGGITCARGVRQSCFSDNECGDIAQCLNGRCRCRPGQREEQILDSIGHKITRCINGIDQIRFSPILLLFFVFVRIFFV